jgi:UDP-N-acetylmuramyl tripeptide synthase
MLTDADVDESTTSAPTRIFALTRTGQHRTIEMRVVSDLSHGASTQRVWMCQCVCVSLAALGSGVRRSHRSVQHGAVLSAVDSGSLS